MTEPTSSEPSPAPRWGWVGAWAFPVACLVVVVALVVVATMVSTRHRRRDSAAVDADRTACRVRWPNPRSGRETFRVTNHTRDVVGVELVGLPGLEIHAEIEMLAPRTRRSLDANLGRGRYQWRCEIVNGATLDSPTFTVTGARITTPTFRPVSSLALLGAVATFHDSVVAGVAQLVADTDRLTQAVDQGQLAAARPLWLTAHLDYARLGGAYTSFGDLDRAIDGRPDGLRDGVDDPTWTGFLRLERALWTGQPATTASAVADVLDRDVHRLATLVTTTATDPTDLTTRVHEILENGLQFELTGQTDQGSHTNLATLRADVDGTETALAAVTPLLQSVDPELLAVATSDVRQVGAHLDALRRADGTWPPVDGLTRTQHQQLDGSIGQAVEHLAPIPDVLELTRDASDD